MIRRGPQVLAERYDVDRGALQVVERRGYLVGGLAQAQHQARLREHVRTIPLRVREHVERLLVTGTRVANSAREPLDGLEVLREHVEAGVDDGLDVRKL